MTMTCYPKTGAKINGAMWGEIFGRGDGIIDCAALNAGGARLTTSSDTATIAPFRVYFDGFILDSDASVALTLPAVGSTTVYSIGIMSNPANDATGRLSLVSGPKASLTIPAGGKYLPFYEVTRTSGTPMSATTPVVPLVPVPAESTYYFGVSNPSLLPAADIGRVAILSDQSQYVRVPDGTSSARWAPVPAQPWARFTAITSPAQSPSVRANYAIRWNASPAAQQAGVSWSAGSYLIAIPQSGVWTIQATVNLSALQTGRSYLQIKNNGDDTYFARNTFAGEDYCSVVYTNYLTASSSVKVESYLSNAAQVQAGSYITLTRVSA